MSLFRRKLDKEKAPDERSGASAYPETRAAAGQEEPGAESSGSSEFLRGLIETPAAGSVVSGVVDVETRLAETAVPVEARLECSLDGEEWAPAVMPGTYHEIVAVRTGASPIPVALVRSTELSERTKRLLARQGHEQVELAPARPSSWRGGERFIAGWDTSDLADGGCFLRLVTVAADRSEIVSNPVRVLVDNLGPELSLREELASPSLTGLVTLIADAEDAVSGVSLVELEISSDGKSWRRISEAREEPFALHLNADELANGSYKIQIVARDGSGNLSRGEPREIEVANTPAAAELVDPGEYLRGRVNLIARTSDRRSTQMIFEIADAGSDDWRALGTARAPFHLSVDTRQIVDGSYELRIESLTTGGLSTYSGRSGPYVVDNTPPTVEIVEPRDGSELSERAELVVAVSDETSGPAEIVLSFTEGGEWRPLAALEPEAGEVRGFWQVGECQPGRCQLRATAFDRAGNEASQIIGITIASPPEPVHESEPERTSAPAPEPESVAPVAVHLPSSEAATRFGSVPDWDWQRSAPKSEESQSEEEPAEQETATVSSPELTAEAPGSVEKPVVKGVAWRWTARESAPELEPEIGRKQAPKSEQPEPEQPEVTQMQKLEPERDPSIEEEPEKAPAPGKDSAEPAADEAQAKEEPREADRDAEQRGRLVNFPSAVRGWDLWQLGDLVEKTPGQDPVRQEERRQILYHLREHVALDGLIPREFDDLVYEAFGELIPDDSTA